MEPRSRIKLLVLTLTLAAAAQAREITFYVQVGSPPLPHNKEIIIKSNEVAVITDWQSPHCAVGGYSGSHYNLDVWLQEPAVPREGMVYCVRNVCSNPPRLPMRIAGPAILNFISPALVTLQILPDPFPPGQTIIIHEGQGANIVLECSTNLVDWAATPPGLHTNAPAPAKFFRIRAERLTP